MKIRASLVLGMGLALVAIQTACREPGRHGNPAGEGKFLLQGRVVDAETGKRVSRDHIYLHFFCDDVDHQTSLDPDESNDYAVRMPEAKIRVRVADKTNEYFLFETTLTLSKELREFDIALRPTHFVLLRGHLVDRGTGKPIVPTRGMGAGPLVYISAADTSWRGDSFLPAPDGSFSLRVPRTKLSVATVNTALGVVTPEIDLTGVKSAEHVLDIALE